MRLQPTATCKADSTRWRPTPSGFFVPRRIAVWGDRAGIGLKAAPVIPAVICFSRRQGGAIVAKDVVLAPVKVSGTVRGGIPTFRASLVQAGDSPPPRPPLPRCYPWLAAGQKFRRGIPLR